MIDDSYLYKKDFDENYNNFKQSDLKGLFSDLYKSGRLSSGNNEINEAELLDFVKRYNENVKLIELLTTENVRLQHWVHKLGIKNRVKKLLGKFRPLEDVKSFLTENEMESIQDGTFSDEKMLSSVAFSLEALKHFKKLNEDSFVAGIEKIQRSLVMPILKIEPKISIIIPTRNGIHHLRRLFSNFEENTTYKNYEILVVDNASTDDTVKYIEGIKNNFNIKLIKNKENKSFSESNNIASKKASGEYLLFLNNDVVPTYGWLSHMITTALKSEDVGAVGSKLIYPYKEGFTNSHKIQHGGLGFKLEPNFIRPVNVNNGSGFFESNTSKEQQKIGVTAACMLVEKNKFDEVGMFTEDYWYGYEDVDLCLKLIKNGYKNIINNASVLYHYEFGTQSKTKEEAITSYRKKNIRVFKNHWQKELHHNYWKSLLEQDGIYTDKKPHICFITTESKDSTAAGDYFTAKELGIALRKRGFVVSFIGVRNTPNPYSIPEDVDAVISMIDGYDISKIHNSGATKIAWCRNWFERWANHEYFRDFDIVLTNSEKSHEYFKAEHHIDSYIFKIATNKDRFLKEYSEEELKGYESDICFTGNYWHDPRDITKLFDPSSHQNKNIKIYGRDWDHVESFKPYHQGFINYAEIPKVYKSGKILIDDATWIVNEWGSVNSRVFDGAASGILVLSNGVVGSKNTFSGLIPTFSTKEELDDLLDKYLNSDSARNKKIKEIQQFVLKHHTYDNRAEELINILKKENAVRKINIKMPIPRWSEAKSWGDLHFAEGIRKQLIAKGYSVKLQVLKDWDKLNFGYANIVLRGLSVFTLPDDQLNIMWNISHPDKVTPEEYKSYDHVFIASSKHTNNLRLKGLTNISVLNQCFDEEVFNTEPAKNPEKYRSDILFVGNTRNHFRKIVRDALSWKDIDKYNFKVYGKGWEKFIDKKYIAGEHIENSELKYYYQNTKILLNDHWDDMNEYGFVSNRLFDASACGTFIISDSNEDIDKIFGGNIIKQYKDVGDLHVLLDRLNRDTSEREKNARKAHTVVAGKQTFKNRIDQIVKVFK